MLRNPAYAGPAIFGKTQSPVNESAGLNRVARLQGRTTPRHQDRRRPREEWTTIPVPAIVSTDTFDRGARGWKTTNVSPPATARSRRLLQGLAACAGCGYGYYRTSTRTTDKNLLLPVSRLRRLPLRGRPGLPNKPVRADYLDQVVWDHGEWTTGASLTYRPNAAPSPV